jgi:diguanylate cyclase (GGDEF)-like protein
VSNESQPPGERFQLQLLFLGELAKGYRNARDAQERYLRAPADTASLDTLWRFFHTIAGSALSAGMGILGAHAALAERALGLARQGVISDPSIVAQLISDSLVVIGLTLEEHGAGRESARPLPSLHPRPLDAVEGRALPDAVGEGRQLSKILVVDDDEFSAGLIDNTLRSSGFVSSFSTSGADALERIEKELPDLVILDVAMPEMDGFELCQRVRAHPALQFTPIIFVTRKGDLEERVRGLEVGGNDYIAKPFEHRELVARVRSHLTRLAALRQMAIRDGLTRCFNHRYFKTRLAQELARAARYAQPMAIAMIDVDHFKVVNDRHGHLTGDMVLAHLAGVVLTCVRGTDVVARYGGEEFGVLMIQSGVREAELIAERIRSRVQVQSFNVLDSTTGEPTGAVIALTVSVGVATIARDDTLVTLIERADKALYDAKSAGRNAIRVV